MYSVQLKHSVAPGSGQYITLVGEEQGEETLNPDHDNAATMLILIATTKQDIEYSV